MVIQLGIDVPIETVRQLTSLKKDDLPSPISLDQARGMHPWVDQLFAELSNKADVFFSKYQVWSDMVARLEVDVSMETVRQLMSLERTDLLSCVSLDQARGMHPWVDQLFTELSNRAGAFFSKYQMRVMYYALFHENVDIIFQQASRDVFPDASRV